MHGHVRVAPLAEMDPNTPNPFKLSFYTKLRSKEAVGPAEAVLADRPMLRAALLGKEAQTGRSDDVNLFLAFAHQSLKAQRVIPQTQPPPVALPSQLDLAGSAASQARAQLEAVATEPSRRLITLETEGDLVPWQPTSELLDPAGVASNIAGPAVVRATASPAADPHGMNKYFQTELGQARAPTQYPYPPPDCLPRPPSPNLFPVLSVLAFRCCCCCCGGCWCLLR
jgi:hypothetical protein